MPGEHASRRLILPLVDAGSRVAFVRRGAGGQRVNPRNAAIAALRVPLQCILRFDCRRTTLRSLACSSVVQREPRRVVVAPEPACGRCNSGSRL